MSKTRSDSVLSQLTEEQQAQVYDWLVRLGYTETLNKVSAPPPDGLGLHTHRRSLQRFLGDPIQSRRRIRSRFRRRTILRPRGPSACHRPHELI